MKFDWCKRVKKQGYVLFTVIILATISLNVYSHGGRLDKNGGHKQAAESYHCHQEPCLSTHKKSNKALNEAIQEKRAFSNLYNRSDWPHWSDLDKDCQDTRVETLIHHSSVKVTFQENNPCEEVTKGKWYDPYTNRYFTDASKLDVDHRIALKEAHRYGGSDWNTAKRKAFANDPINLIPVYLGSNRSKGYKPAYKWMPENKDYWCEYIRTRVTVANKYGLKLPAKEQMHNREIKSNYCT